MWISESGHIRVPKQLLDEVTKDARLLLLSYAYHATRLDHNIQKHHNTILQLLKHYNIKPIEKHLLNSVISIDVDDSDLPDSYHKFETNKGKKVVLVRIDHNETKFLGAFKKPNIIVICVQVMYKLLADPTISGDMILDTVADFDNTIDHELTHWVQNTYLHKMNIEKHYDIEKDKSMVPYYTSQVEFDPILKSEIVDFASKVRKAFPNGKFNMNDVMQYYVGASHKSLSDLGLKLNGFTVLLPSNYFKILKESKKDWYKKAVKIFCDKAPEAYHNYKKFTKTVTDTKADRLDYIWGKFRANEFTNFVNLLNSFIDYRKTRQAEFQALVKYLPKIDDEFKESRVKDKTFLMCNEQAIQSVKNKKAFIIPVVFVDHTVHGTGMMFDISGLPMILDVSKIINDKDFIEICDDYELRRATIQDGLAIVDGANFKFGGRALIGTYINNKLVGE